jgi:predicted Zn-dependent protease with MMP-like domain
LAFPAVDSKTIGPTGAKCQNGQKTAAGAAGRVLNVPIDMPLPEFEDAVNDAIDRIPEEIAREMTNVGIFVEEEYEPQAWEDPETELLGLYEGTPLTERDHWWEAGSLPDRITVFRGPILRMCESREEVVHEVLVTVIHEVAHHFGIADERLHELGWG